MWEGCLSGPEFCAEAAACLERWRAEESGSGCRWRWQPQAESTAGGYLVLDRDDVVLQTVTSSDAEDEEDLRLGSSDECNDCIDDPAALPVQQQQQSASFVYNVIYSESYAVPVLFFRGSRSDGRALSSAEELRRFLPGARPAPNSSPWTFLTQEEHPFLHRPWFTLHPCATREVMAALLLAHARGRNAECRPGLYLLSWLVVVAPVVRMGLQFSPEQNCMVLEGLRVDGEKTGDASSCTSEISSTLKRSQFGILRPG